MVHIPKISDNHEYVLDTSVIRAANINYSKEMQEKNPDSNENYDHINSVCFSVLSELIRAKVAIDKKHTILFEYETQVFDPYPNDYPAKWFTMMESRGKIVPKDISWEKDLSRHMQRHFHLSRVDCCLVHVAERASSKKVLHREKGISKAAGYINKHFGVEQINVMKVKS